ncbi:MAG: hypothetical protein IKL20_04365 [Alistipes sp.]|nr:hypothetical protein [Alistipes sp.]
MKNFTKLLMSVVLLTAAACTQDLTDDQAPVISENGGGSGEVKTLQVSMPTSTRTELGEKVDGKYPVSWSETDVLAVNGKPTTGIHIDEAAPNVAVFDLPQGITIPFHIVYPYQGENVAVEANSGKYPVVFSAEQQHTEGSFAPNSAPMYAWTSGFEDIHMEHLATALRFAIKAKAGQTVDLKYISVSTTDAAPIAGVFDVYCTDKDEVAAGTLEARKNTYPTVFYNFENDSYKLSSDKEDVFYIAVPKGEYTTFEVNFVEQSGRVYTETFDASGDRQLLGGKVREFPSVVFDLDECSKMLLIGTDVDMQTLANEVKAGTFNGKYDGALLVSDIDMTGKAWEPLDGFSSLFEGRGFSIKGLSKPLFGENVVGTISNVKVEGNIVEEKYGRVGLIARSLTVEGDKVGTMFNCAATGSIEYKNTTLAITNDYKLINIGGVVGGVYGGKVSLNESDVDVTITTIAGAEGKTKEFYSSIGGVVGYACADGDKLPVVVENVSNGTIVWNDNSKSEKAFPYIGGVAGYVADGAFESNVNVGELTIDEPMLDLDWGGVIGASNVSVVNCENKGLLAINHESTRSNIGGVVGRLEANSIVNCVNSGKLMFDENFFVKEKSNIGGVVAYAVKGTKEIKECSNSGSIEYLGSCYYQDRTTINGNANIVIGGVIGTSWSELVSECHNQQSAVLRIVGKIAGNGDIKNNKATIDKNTAIAGVIGVRAGKQATLGTAGTVKTQNCSNMGNVNFEWQYCGAAYVFNSACIGIFESDYISDCKNSGSVNVKANVSTDTFNHPTTGTLVVFISGMFGYISDHCDQIYNCENAGWVTVSGSSSRMMWVSGLLGTAESGVNIKFNNCGNTGNILVNDDVNVRNVYVGGILANTLDIKLQYPNCYNSGSVESKANCTAETYIGSIFGQSTGSDTGAGTEGIRNTGRVTFSGSAALAYVGGYCGLYKEGKHTVEFDNASTGVVEYKGNASFCAFVGGIAGLGGSITTNSLTSSQGVVTEIKSFNANEGGAFEKGMTNNGNVTIYGYAKKVYVSGGFGYITSKNNGISGLTNNGTIEVPDMSNAKNLPESIHIGGVFGYATMNTAYPTTEGAITEAKAISDCHNTGDIIYKGMATDGAYIGGVAGWTSKAALWNCTNNGKITSAGHAGNTCPRFNEATEKATANNWRNIMTHDIAVGGIVGETDFDMVNCENIGEISHECLLNPLRVDYLGELATSRFDVGGIAGRVFTPQENTLAYICSFGGLTNKGKVTILGTPASTNNSPSADMGDANAYQWTDVDDNDRQNRRLFVRVNAAGLFGRMMDLSKMPGTTMKETTYKLSGCTNEAAVSVPNAGGAKCLSLAGGIADVLVSNLECTAVENKGNISVDGAGVGTVIDGAQMMHTFFINMGGIVATHFDYRLFGNLEGDFSKYKHYAIFTNCNNSGNIHYGEVAASVYQIAGGIVGQALHCAADRCTNIGLEGYSGGKWYKSQLQLQFYNCKNSGDIEYRSTAMSLTYNYNYAGGILGSANMGHNGFTQHYGNINVWAEHCTNTGSIQWDRSNGVVSSNSGYANTAVGGIIGQYTGGIGHSTNSDTAVGGNLGTRENACNATIKSCKNSGRIHGFSGMLGGIIGCGSWYVKITGTEDDPTINTGDIVVMREGGSETEKGRVVTSGRYGQKYMYAGGIAGILREYTSAVYAVGSAKATDNNAYPNYMPEHMYCRVEYAVNEGAVGSTGYAGGIAGYYWSAVEPSKRDGAEIQHRGGMQWCRNTGDIYALEGATTNVGAIVGMPRMFVYTSNTNNDVAKYLSEGMNTDNQWPIGVKDCYVGGSILRGAVTELKVDANNYQNAIYGEAWNSDSFVSISDDGDFDGCTPYVAPAPEQPTPGL